MFLTTIIQVGIMFIYAVPAFILIKTNVISKAAIPAFAKVLMYVCQPFLTIYAFGKVDFSPQLIKNMGIFFVLSLLLQVIILLIFYFIFRKKYDNIKYRVATISTCFGNVTFIGLPLIEALLPDCKEAAIYSVLFFITMSILGWTVASFLITGDKKHMSIKNIILNPATLSLFIALPMLIFGIKLPNELMNMCTLLGKMCTPMCMFVLGMRLATVPFKQIINCPVQYIAILVKQLICPVLAFVIAIFLPLDANLKTTLIILSMCPTAAVVLNFAEMLEVGQDTAANTVLLSTITSIITIPLMTLLLV